MLWPLAVVWGGDIECEVRAGDRPQQHGVSNTPELQTSASWRNEDINTNLPSQSLLPSSCRGPLYSFLLTFFFPWSLNAWGYLIPQETWTKVLELTEQWICRWDSPWSQTIGSGKYIININIYKTSNLITSNIDGWLDWWTVHNSKCVGGVPLLRIFGKYIYFIIVII